MKKIIVYITTFIIMLNLCSPVVTFAGELPEGVTDYSGLVPDGNGRYWIYFEIVSDELMLTDETINNCDLQIVVDVTDYYLKYGHAGFFAYTNTYGKLERIMSTCNIPTSTSSYNVNFDFVINGFFNDIVFENYAFSHSSNFLDNIVSKLGLSANTANNFIHSSSYGAIKYLPVMGSTAVGNDSEYLFFDYLQAEPTNDVFVPQEVAFAYDYNSKNEVVGFDIYLRHLYPTAQDFYANSNVLQSLPYVNSTAGEYVNTLFNFKLTAVINGQEVTTDWLPLDIVPYCPGTSISFSYPSYNIFDLGALFEIYYFDYEHLCVMDFERVPSLFAELGLNSGGGTVTLKTLEISSQNHNTLLDSYSKINYASYDFYSNDINNGVVTTTPSINNYGIHGITSGDVTTSTTIKNDVSVSLPTINNAVNEGDTNVFVNNNMPNDINLNLKIDVPESDGDTGFFGWFADKIGDAADTVEDIDSGFKRLSENLDKMVGRFPSLFEWVYAGLPANYVIWLELSIAVGVVGMVFCIWRRR